MVSSPILSGVPHPLLHGQGQTSEQAISSYQAPGKQLGKPSYLNSQEETQGEMPRSSENQIPTRPGSSMRSPTGSRHNIAGPEHRSDDTSRTRMAISSSEPSIDKERSFTSPLTTMERKNIESERSATQALLNRVVQLQSGSSWRTRKPQDPTVVSKSLPNQQEIEQKNAEIRSIREQWQLEVKELLDQVTRLKEESAGLQVENNHLILARQERERAGKDPQEYQLFRNSEDIWKLKRRILEMEELEGFTQRSPTQKTSFEPKRIDEAMDLIGCELDSILNGHDTKIPLQTLRLVSNSDLWSIVRTALTTGIESGREELLLKRCIHKFDQQTVIRSFVMASLRLWVFETGYPHFANEESRTLHAYRNSILTYDGWKNLQNLELAAYHSLVDGHQFQEILLPREAALLAARLSRALAPLFPRSFQEENLEFDSWGDDDEVSEDRRFRFIGIFETALKLKATLVPTDQRYEFVVYPPGTPQIEKPANLPIQPGYASPYQQPSPSTLHGEINACQGLANPPSGLQKPESAQSWLYASLHVYPPELSPNRDSLSDALLKPNNFITGGELIRVKDELHSKFIILRRSQSVRSITDSNEGGYTHVETETAGGCSLRQETINRGLHDTRNRPNVTPSGPEQMAILENSRGSPLAKTEKTVDGSTQHEFRFERQASESVGPDEHLTTSSEGSVCCVQCGRRFKGGAGLAYHMRGKIPGACASDNEKLTQGGEIFFKCETCSKAFIRKSDLLRHEQNNSCARCSPCDRIFSGREELRHHLKTQHAKKPRANSMTEKALVRPLPVEKNDMSRNKKPQPTDTAKELEPASGDFKIFMCGGCGRGHKLENNMKAHQRGCIPQCYECAEVFPNHRSLNEHWKTTHHKTATANAHDAKKNVPINTKSVKSARTEKSLDSSRIINAQHSDEMTRNRPAKRVPRMSDRPRARADYREENSDVEILDEGDARHPSNQKVTSARAPSPQKRGPPTSPSRKRKASDASQAEVYGCIICGKEYQTESGRASHQRRSHACLEPTKWHKLDKTDVQQGINPILCDRCDQLLLRTHIPLKNGTSNKGKRMDHQENSEDRDTHSIFTGRAANNAAHTGEVGASWKNANTPDPHSSSAGDRRDFLPSNAPMATTLSPMTSKNEPADHDRRVHIKKRKLSSHTAKQISSGTSTPLEPENRNKSRSRRLSEERGTTHKELYTCLICNRGYNKRASLDRHYRDGHQIEPLACVRCQERFRTHSLLQRHEERGCKGVCNLGDEETETTRHTANHEPSNDDDDGTELQRG